MRVLLVTNLLIICIGIGYSFRITEFLDPFFKQNLQNEQERQSTEISDQVMPLFGLTFIATLILNYFMNTEEYHWCYTDPSCGPATWGDHYEYCNGMSQSPINIPQNMASSGTSTLNFATYANVRIDVFANTVEHYGNVRMPTNRANSWPNDDAESRQAVTDSQIKNNGHTAQLDVSSTNTDGILSGGPLEAGKQYQILQLHFHWGKDDTRGSEHTLGGHEYPLEMHIVHTRTDLVDVTEALETPKGLAVTGFFFQIDATDNAALTPITDALADIVDSKSELAFDTTAFNIDTLISPANAGSYTYYSGSLTTPTCNEVVEWLNFLTPLSISSKQLALFRELMDGKGKMIVDNYRPPQPLNGRTVVRYTQ